MDLGGIPLINFFWALVGGIVPTFLWLWFWFNQVDRPESPGFLSLLYIFGMVCVVIIFPIDVFIKNTLQNPKELLLAFAVVEEVMKLAMTALLAFRRTGIEKPTDYTLFLVTLALGFSGLENTLYLIQPITHNNISFVLFTGNLRFIGATLLHTICVAIVGIMIGIAFNENRFMKGVHAIFGLGIAILLHAIFNYFILVNTTRSIMIGLAGLWFIGIVVIVIFGRLRKWQTYDFNLSQSEPLTP